MCAVVGIFGNSDAAKLAVAALFQMQHRGHESSGITSGGEGCGGKMVTVKDGGFVRDIFDKERMLLLKGNMAIGHNRYSTAGSESLFDAQPIQARCNFGDISIVHNGNLINKDEVRNQLIEEGSIFQTNMDTENVIHLIAKSKQVRLRDKIKDALDIIKGAYSFIIQSNDKQYVIRDRHGIRPLSIGKIKSGGWVIASETCCFDLVDATFVRDVRPGEMLVFTKDAVEPESIQMYEPDFHPCAFEFVYLARPDSDIAGVNIYQCRETMGRKLAIANPVDADMVVPVPDSGVAAALGYARESGIPFELGIIRNHYVGRTFIEPSQAIRDMKVKMKLSPQRSLINGKKLVVIDDSLVRGTTSKRIVKMLKDAGAAEVHFRVAAPEIKFPDVYGIDTPTKEELISSGMSKDEVCAFLEADSLEFLSIEDLVDSISCSDNYSLVSFDGNYFVK